MIGGREGQDRRGQITAICDLPNILHIKCVGPPRRWLGREEGAIYGVDEREILHR